MVMSEASMLLVNEGVRSLAIAVLAKAGEDYIKLKRGSRRMAKLDGCLVPREEELERIEGFFGKRGAQEYVDLAGLSLDPSAILRKL
jgi:hypothetical protein